MRRLVFAAAMCAAALPAEAQARLQVLVTVPPPASRTTEGPMVSIQNIFADKRSQDLLANAFPARIAVVVELWASRTLFDKLLGSVSWQRIVQFDALSSTYRIGRVVSPDSIAIEGRVSTLQEAQRLLQAPARASLPAPQSQRGLYYTVNVTVETFNSNDLAEVQRWLSGDIQKNPISAVKRGVLTIFSRLLGGDVKRESGRSEVFETS